MRAWVRVLSRKAGESVDLLTIQNARRLENFDVFVNGLTGKLQWDLYREDTDQLDATLESGRWYFIEAQVEFAAGQYTADVRIDGVDQGTITSTQAQHDGPGAERRGRVGEDPQPALRRHRPPGRRRPDGVADHDHADGRAGRARRRRDLRPRRGGGPTLQLRGPDFAVATCDGPAEVDTPRLGPHALTVTATDTGGRSPRPPTPTRWPTSPIRPSEITPPRRRLLRGRPDGRGGRLLDCADEVGGSGLAVVNGCAGPVADGAAIDTVAAGSHPFTVTATDAAGNTTSVTTTYWSPVVIPDDTDPVVELRRPVDGAEIGRNEVVEADFVCADEPGGSGLADLAAAWAPGPAAPPSTRRAWASTPSRSRRPTARATRPR